MSWSNSKQMAGSVAKSCQWYKNAKGSSPFSYIFVLNATKFSKIDGFKALTGVKQLF